MASAVFDEVGRCISITENEDGILMVDDITDGLKMANRSGRSAADERHAVLANCVTCNKEIVRGGDRAILRRRTPTEEGAFQCRECFWTSTNN